MDPLRDAQDQAPVCFCPECGGEVWPGETMYTVDGRPVCSDCFDAWVDRFRHTSPALFADAMGVFMTKLEA